MAIITPDNNITASGHNTTEENSEGVTLESPKEVNNNDTADASLALNLTLLNAVENKTIDECKNCPESVSLNEINDKDTVKNYVSGKNEDIVPKKTSSHIRNSLKRRKRSFNIRLDNIRSNSAPEIINYETRHDLGDREIIIPVLKRTENLIKNSNLADFNIETLHEPVKQLHNNNKEDEENKNRLYNKPPLPSEDSNKSIERDVNPDERQKSEINGSSEESIERSNDDSGKRTHGSHKRLPADSNDSLETENLKSAPRNSDSKESQESEESDEVKSENLDHNEPRGRSIDSEEVEVYPPREKYFKNSRNEDEEGAKYPSKTDSNESDEETGNPKEELKQLNLRESETAGPKLIQDVDLGDFSYERIQVNKDGKVELDNDTYDKDDNDSREDVPVNEERAREKESPRAEYIEKVNNGEIKPVVEINTESNSNEYSDESIETVEPQIAELNKEDKSLETLLGTKENDNGEKNEKQVVQNTEQPSGNVKEQFERIPLNYKHDKKTAEGEEKSEPTDNQGNDKDGTLDTLLPKDQRYDDKLNFKFDDVTIKLPEIKLPDDILAYNYESPYSKKKNDNKSKDKQRFYHYSDEHSDENPIKEISIPQYDDDRGYYRYDEPNEEKQDYRKKSQHDNEDDDDDHVDLYEKFVRERFGKRGSFEKRSEELRNEVFRPSNPKLSETIKQILKRSEATQKQAEKSGDPKAGYMWTLEYGENL